MATLLDLSTKKDSPLIKVDPGLEPSEQEWRAIYAGGRFQPWLINDLPNLVSEWQIEETPLQQLDALLEVFASGEALTYGHRLNPLNHLGDGVWELKTADLRIFGWFPCKDHFIGVVADTAYRCKKHDLYAGYAGETVRFRDKLDLDQPKFIPGDDPHAVVSNLNYP